VRLTPAAISRSTPLAGGLGGGFESVIARFGHKTDASAQTAGIALSTDARTLCGKRLDWIEALAAR
jgi:hypothetical protein